MSAIAVMADSAAGAEAPAGAAPATVGPAASRPSLFPAPSAESPMQMEIAQCAEFLHTAPRSMMRLVTADDFVAAMKRVGPSMARGAAVEYRPIKCAAVAGSSLVAAVCMLRIIAVVPSLLCIVTFVFVLLQLGRHWGAECSETTAEVRPAPALAVHLPKQVHKQYASCVLIILFLLQTSCGVAVEALWRL